MANNHSQYYTDEELRAKANVVLRHMQRNEDCGMELILKVSMITGMHPQLVVAKIQELSNIQL